MVGSGLSVLLMQPCWKWLVHREKLWPDLSDGLVRVPRSPNLKPFFGAKGAWMLPCWQSCLTDAGRHSHKHWLGEDYEKVLKQSGFCFTEAQNVKEITFKTYISKAETEVERQGGEGGEGLKTKAQQSGHWFWQPNMKFSPQGPRVK